MPKMAEMQRTIIENAAWIRPVILFGTQEEPAPAGNWLNIRFVLRISLQAELIQSITFTNNWIELPGV
jgi:hypothetical protein